jgi:hypothetical protein
MSGGSLSLMAKLATANFQQRQRAAAAAAGAAAGGPGSVSAARLVVLCGPSGVGKSTLASTLLRNAEVQAAFDGGLCWASVGQTPDLRQLLGSLLAQLSPSRAPSGSASVAALSELLEAAATEIAAEGRRMLCVLDDVWDAEHAKVLGAPFKAATLVLTTRIRKLIPAAFELHCPVMGAEEALALLLQAGGVSEVEPGSVAQRAAKLAVELCGR